MKKLSYGEIGKLLEKARTGDDQAFAVLYSATVEAQYYSALRLVKNQTLAEEVVQDVYVSLYQHMDTITEPKGLVAYLGRVNFTKCMDILNKEKKYSDEDVEERQNSLVSTELDPAEAINIKDERERINLTLSKMDPRLSSVLVMRYAQDLKIEEISKATGFSMSTVNRYLKKGVVEMRRLYNKIKNSALSFVFLSPWASKAIKNSLANSTTNDQKASMFEKISDTVHMNPAAVTVSTTSVVIASAGIQSLLASKGFIASVAIAGASVTGVVIPPSYSMEIIDAQIPTNQTTEVAITHKGSFDIRAIRAHDEQQQLYTNCLGNGCSLFFADNGTYSIEIDGVNGSVAKTSVTISNIDHTCPVVSNLVVGETTSSVILSDDLSGIDYSTLSIVSENGQPVEYYVEGSTITFSNNTPVIDLTVYDNLGNKVESHISIY